MTSPNDVIERLEAGLTELVNQLRGSIDESTPPRLVEWLTLDAQRAEALLPLVAEAASLIKTLREERDVAVKAFEDGLEPRIKRFTFEDGQFDAVLTGEAVEATSIALVSHFKALGAENYVEMSIYDRADPYQRYVVTVQKVGKLSPHDKAKAAADALTQAVETEREECAKVCDAVAADIRTNPHDFGPIDAGGMRAAEKAGQFIRARSTQDTP